MIIFEIFYGHLDILTSYFIFCITSPLQLVAEVDKLNQDPGCHGMIVQVSSYCFLLLIWKVKSDSFFL